MNVVPDAGLEGQPVRADRVPNAGPSPPGGDGEAAHGANDVEARLRAARRARRRTRFRQAVAGRRRSVLAWGETAGRWWVGVVLLLVVGSIAWIEIALLREPTDPAAPSTGLTAASRSASGIAAVPTAASSPTVEPEVPPGPEVSTALIEANGPIAGCTFSPGFADLRAKIGADLVGECVEAPQTTSPGEARQRTTRGELFWWEPDRRAAFTDGAHSWITGPRGIVRRRNEERFAWERDADAGPRPATTTHVLPPALPGSILPSRRIVSYYGNPLSGAMGILGELPPEQVFARLREQAAGYQSADKDRETIPALELVAVVAQPEGGPDGLHRLRMDTDLIEQVAGWAEEQGFLLILDVQIGRGNVEDEVRWLLPFLKRPHVHLALDPEFAMPPSQAPGERIGTMDASAINSAMRILADLVTAEELPPKLLVVHRFTENMVTNYQEIATDPKVQVVMVMDGFGSPAHKEHQYDTLIAEQPVQYTGFKLFYRHDDPLMTPEQVLLLDPPPDLIIYQ